MATIKFSEFDAGNINIGGAQLVGLTGGNSATNARFTAADLVNGLATITYVDSQDAGLQSQITQNTNDVLVLQGNVISLENDVANIVDLDEQTLSWDGPAGNLAISKGNFVILQEVLDNGSNIATLQGQVSVLEGNVVSNGSNIATLQGQVSVLEGNVVSIEAELANINTDSQTLTYDGANANLSISNGNSVVLQEVLDNAGNITTMQGQIADLQANGNIQTLSLNNSSNVLSISGGNTVDFTTVLAGGGNPFNQDLNTTDSPTFDNLSTTGELDVNGSGNHNFEGTIIFSQITNFGGTVGITSILDEDDMVSDSATALATQQSIKAYVDANAGGGGIAAVVDDTSPELGGTLNSNGFNIEMSSSTPIEFGIEWNDGSGTKYGDIVAQPDSNEFEISSGSGAQDLVLVGDRDIEIKTGLLGRDIIIGDLTWPASDGSAGQAIVTDGSGTLSFTTNFSLASLDVANANITTNASTNSLDIQFDSRPVAKITSGVMVQVHGSWDASAGAAFSWATDEIASHGISNVTRDSAGIFTVTFETPFASDAYTATFGVGSTDYTGSGASPREVSLLSRTANNCQVICERSDDAVNEDNFYMSLMICGVI